MLGLVKLAYRYVEEISPQNCQVGHIGLDFCQSALDLLISESRAEAAKGSVAFVAWVIPVVLLALGDVDDAPQVLELVEAPIVACIVGEDVAQGLPERHVQVFAHR